MVTKFKWQLLPPPKFKGKSSPPPPFQTPFVQRLYERRFQSIEALIPEKYALGTLECIQEPFDIPELMTGAQCLVKHLEANHRVAIFCDYDVDGICGGTLLRQFITEAYPQADISIFQSNRMVEGYGLNLHHVERLRDFSCLITVDCGSASIDPIGELTEFGCDVIVTDHHECALNQEGKVIRPAATAFINPKRPDSPHYFSFISGTGAVFMLCCAMRKFSDACAKVKLTPYLDLVCTSIISDAVPLINENRIFVRYGLQIFNTQPRPYLKKLLDHTHRYGPIDETILTFAMIPKMNAPGRMGSASPVLEGLMATSPDEVQRCYQATVEQNEARMNFQAQSWATVEPLAEAQQDQDVLCIYHPEIHEGVLGILASRLCEKYQKPALVLANSQIKGEIRGSGRAYGSLSVLDVVHQFSGYFSRYGGHKAAVGLTLHESNLKPLLESMASYKRKTAPASLLIDEEVSLSDLTLPAVQELESLGPYGQSFPTPLFLIRNVRIPKLQKLKGEHLKGVLDNSHSSVEFVAWKSGELAPFIRGTDRYHVVVKVRRNFYREPTVQCELVDIEKA